MAFSFAVSPAGGLLAGEAVALTLTSLERVPGSVGSASAESSKPVGVQRLRATADRREARERDASDSTFLIGFANIATTGLLAQLDRPGGPKTTGPPLEKVRQHRLRASTRPV